jgi:nicotinate-nucleotide pyrophosphorylase (carboxylating)
VYSLPEVSAIVALALAEDLGVPVEDLAPDADSLLFECDVTSHAILEPGATFAGAIVAREPLVVAGLPVAERVWSTLVRAARGRNLTASDAEAADVEVFPLVAEGARVDAGARIAEVSGPARTVLSGERTALNFLMVLSGIATETARWVAQAGPALSVCDTRKTFPGLRSLSKYAVRVGGGTNHRLGLWDMVLVKDNHIASAGDVASAMSAVRRAEPEMLVEVEADSVEAALKASRAGADIVLLDNMPDHVIVEAVRAVREVADAQRREILTEASGGVTIDRLERLRATGVDRVSTSALTLARPVDLALDEG